MIKIFEILPYFDGKKTQLASALGVSKQAVSKWPDGILPDLREKQIRHEILPHIYKKKKKRLVGDPC